MEEPMRYLTQSDIARRSGVTPGAVAQAVRASVLRPDAYAGKAAIFRPSTPSVIAYINRERRK